MQTCTVLNYTGTKHDRDPTTPNYVQLGRKHNYLTSHIYNFQLLRPLGTRVKIIVRRVGTCRLWLSSTISPIPAIV